MFKSGQNLYPESSEARVNGWERFTELLKRMQLLDKSGEERRFALSQFSPEKLFDLLVISNSVMKDDSKWNRARIMENSEGYMVDDLRPPTNALDLFKVACEEVSQNLVDNPVQAISLLYVSIIFCHPFADGNGRTARTIALFLFGSDIPFPVERNKYTSSIDHGIHSQIFHDIQKETGLDYQIHNAYWDEDDFPANNQTFLKYIACKRVAERFSLPLSDGPIRSIPNYLGEYIEYFGYELDRLHKDITERSFLLAIEYSDWIYSQIEQLAQEIVDNKKE